MPDDLAVTLEGALDAEPYDRGPDLAWVIERGQRKRRMRVLSLALGSVLAVGIAASAIVTFARTMSPTDTDRVPVITTPDIQEGRRGELVEEISEKDRAEIFAFRAVASVGLMDLRGRAYLFTYEEDTTQTPGGWSVGFAASECDPTTCRGLSGEDPETGNASTDTFVVVELENDRWSVVSIEGNMSAPEQERLIGYSLPDRPEPSHWDFPSFVVGGADEGFTVTMVALWVGPYPTDAPGSACEIQPLDADGDPAGEAYTFYQEPPNRAFEQAGWLRGGGVAADADAERVSVRCRQYTGKRWEIVSEPKLVKDPSGVFGVSAELEWRGAEGFTMAARCEATMLDSEGNIVFEGSGRVLQLWRESELRDYPYRATAVVTARGIVSDAESVGEFTCESI
jgi:hypothetical protein